MPTLDRVQSFIARVEQQDYVGAITHFFLFFSFLYFIIFVPFSVFYFLLAHDM